MMVLRHGTHGWGSVCAHPDGFAWVYSIPKGFRCEVNFNFVWERLISGLDHPRYVDCACSSTGNVVGIGVGGDDHAYAAGAHNDVDYGIVFGQNAVAVDYYGGDFHVFLVKSNRFYTVDDVQTPIPDRHQGTSQGFRDVHEGVIAWADDSHVTTIEGVKLHQYINRGGVIVGQIDGSDRIDGFHGVSPRQFTAIELRSIAGPKIAQRGEQYAICAPTTRGAAMNIVPPYPPVFGEPPPPVDPKEPHVANWTEFYNFLEQNWNVLPETTEARSQEKLWALVGEWHHTHGHTGFGLFWKGTHFGDDWIVEKQPDGSMVGQDTITNLGLKNSKVSRTPPRDEPNPQNWREPPKPTGTPPPPPPPADELDARIRAILDEELKKLRIVR